MPFVDTTVEEHVEREDRALSMVSSLAERIDPAQPVGDAWNAHDVVAHLVSVIGRYLNPNVQLATTPREVDELNTREMADFAGLSMAELVAELAGRQKQYQEVWGQLPLDLGFPFHAGLTFDVGALRCNWLSEQLMHGYDAATAAGNDWPLEDRDGLMALRVVLAALPGYWNGEGLGHSEVQFAPEGANPHTIVIDGPQMRVVPSAEAGSPDVVLSGRAAPLALMLYGRIDQAAAEAAGLVVEGDQAALTSLMEHRELP